MIHEPAHRFSLQEAAALLPAIRQRTDEAVLASAPLAARLERLREDDPERASVSESLDAIVAEWTADVRALGAEVKGLWLVDFDNGEGYYCWRHPEPSITHFHTYEDGFAGRMKIV
jgi:hypothetical protein